MKVTNNMILQMAASMKITAILNGYKWLLEINGKVKEFLTNISAYLFLKEYARAVA